MSHLQLGFDRSRLPDFTEGDKAQIKGSADFFGLNHYTAQLTENQISNISDIDYSADQDVHGFQDPSWYG